VRLTTTFGLYGSEQSAPQLIPVGLEVTVPVPVPEIVTVSTGFSVKFAVIDLAASMVTLQPPDPVHAPDQLEKTEPAEGAAVSVTTVFGS
jgi:hypothetical protein